MLNWLAWQHLVSLNIMISDVNQTFKGTN